MMILDRTTAPATGSFPPLALPIPESYRLSNGVEITACNHGDEEVCRIDLVLEGGSYVEQTPGAALFTLLMLREGAGGKSGEEISENLDYYGAWLQTSVSHHYLYITLYTLNRHLDTCVGMLADMVHCPDFPEKEFSQLKERRIQQRRVQLEKVDVLASEAFTTQLFGEKHPYGSLLSLEQMEALTLDDLHTYYQRYFCRQGCHIFVSGKITPCLFDNLERHFGGEWGAPTTLLNPHPHAIITPSPNHIAVVHKEGALQSGIRMGFPTINRNHPDFFALKFLTTILGGYFGSRLMTNIREEKGYTYGIGAGIGALRYGAYLTISTQTGTEFTQPLINEVYNEVERLRTEPVSLEELSIVRNYQRGEMARILDSAFSVTDYYQSLWVNGLSLDYFARQDEVVRTITPEQILDTARRYFIPEQFYIAVAGDKTKLPEPIRFGNIE